MTDQDRQPTDLVRDGEGREEAIRLLITLEQAGAIDDVSLNFTDPDMPYERWEDVGRFLGGIDRRARWYIGDWLNWGHQVYGESQASQAVEGSAIDRYSEAHRVTGLEPGTLMNISSICGRIARKRRRRELPFWTHAEVAALDPDAQSYWLKKAIDKGYTRNDLRDAIRADKAATVATSTGSSGDDTVVVGTFSSAGERIEQAARLVYSRAQQTREGFLIDAETMSQLRAALGEE